MAEMPFGEVCDEESFIVHDEGNLHLRFDLAQNVPNHRIQEELADFVLNRRDGLALKALVIPLILLGPKGPDVAIRIRIVLASVNYSKKFCRHTLI